MATKLQKGIEYKYKIPSYAPLRVGDVVRICNVRNIKKYQNSKEPYMNKLAVVIGYSTKSGGGPMTFAVRVMETGDEYLLYEYLLAKTDQYIWIPKFEEGDEVIINSNKVDGKWATVISAKDNAYEIRISKGGITQTVSERQLRYPKEEEMKYKELEQRIPELEGIL
jgi:hypothetical protein